MTVRSSRRGRLVLFPPAHSLRSRVGDKPALYAVSFGTVLRTENHQPKEKTMTIKRNTKPEPKSPIYHAYTVRDGKEGQKGFWTRIGSSSPTMTAKRNAPLDALPLDGRIVLRAPKADE